MKIKFMHSERRADERRTSRKMKEAQRKGTLILKWNSNNTVSILLRISFPFLVHCIESTLFLKIFKYGSLFTEQCGRKESVKILQFRYTFFVGTLQNRKLKQNETWIRSNFVLLFFTWVFIDMQILHFAIYWGTQDTQHSNRTTNSINIIYAYRCFYFIFRSYQLPSNTTPLSNDV